MDVEQLLAGLRKAGVDERQFVVRGQPSWRGPMDGAVYLAHEPDGRWVVGFYERGTYNPQQSSTPRTAPAGTPTDG